MTPPPIPVDPVTVEIPIRGPSVFVNFESMPAFPFNLEFLKLIDTQYDGTEIKGYIIDAVNQIWEYNQKEFVFQKNNSPSKPNTKHLRGKTINTIILDDMAHYENTIVQAAEEELYKDLKPDVMSIESHTCPKNENEAYQWWMNDVKEKPLSYKDAFLAGWRMRDDLATAQLFILYKHIVNKEDIQLTEDGKIKWN